MHMHMHMSTHIHSLRHTYAHILITKHMYSGWCTQMCNTYYTHKHTPVFAVGILLSFEWLLMAGSQ